MGLWIRDKGLGIPRDNLGFRDYFALFMWQPDHSIEGPNPLPAVK